MAVYFDKYKSPFYRMMFLKDEGRSKAVKLHFVIHNVGQCTSFDDG